MKLHTTTTDWRDTTNLKSAEEMVQIVAPLKRLDHWADEKLAGIKQVLVRFEHSNFAVSGPRRMHYLQAVCR